MNPVKYIERLNKEQKTAYDKVFGPLIVMAPAGTGKTDVIALRAYNAYISGVKPEDMLLLTFTNRAAKSMKKRLGIVIGDIANKIRISTFHGLCGFILRQDAVNLFLSPDFIVIDEDDSRQIIRDIIINRGYKSHLYFKEEQLFVDYIRQAREFPYINEKKFDAKAYFEELIKDRGLAYSLGSLADSISEILNLYVSQLKAYNLMDFTSLVVGVSGAFKQDSIRQRWESYFEWIELDEVQDTNMIEYKIIKTLFQKHGNIALFGDLHQTIYEWRGSQPNEILRDFKINNPGYDTVRFEENYRSTKLILEAAESFLGNSIDNQNVYEDTEKIKVRGFKNLNTEHAYILSKIIENQKTDKAYSNQAVLARTNKDAKTIGDYLESNNIPVFVMDKTRFFSREEIKNALAYIKLMLNPKDILSLKRINSDLVEKFSKEQEKAYLEIGQFLNEKVYKTKDPYLELLKAFESDEVVVFDVETTGLDIKKDKIIQIAALKGGKNGVIQKFERFIKIDYSVGDSFKIHNISDEFLFQNGVDAKSAIEDFLLFSQDSVIVGHNVSYDINILKENMKAIDLNIDKLSSKIFDTLILTRKTYPGFFSYKLGNLFKEFSLNHTPTHNAMDDVICTLEVLEKVVVKLLEKQSKRQAVFTKYQDYFYPIARNLGILAELSKEKRPQDILHEALIRAGLIEKYSKSSVELVKLRELYRIFREYDKTEKPTLESLSELLEIASLGNDTDRFLNIKDQVPVITVHQAKGLEFNTVYLYNATDENFPSSRNQSGEGLKEEKRLFYVAITRPKSNLYITYSVGDEQAKELNKPSRFIHQIERKYIDFR